jgi:hypothetical protein
MFSPHQIQVLPSHITCHSRHNKFFEITYYCHFWIHLSLLRRSRHLGLHIADRDLNCASYLDQMLSTRQKPSRLMRWSWWLVALNLRSHQRKSTSTLLVSSRLGKLRSEFIVTARTTSFSCLAAPMWRTGSTMVPPGWGRLHPTLPVLTTLMEGPIQATLLQGTTCHWEPFDACLIVRGGLEHSGFFLPLAGVGTGFGDQGRHVAFLSGRLDAPSRLDPSGGWGCAP